MSKLFQNYKRTGIEFVQAEGPFLFDSQGKRYLDFSSGIGVTNLGFHEEVKQALVSQVGKIWHTPNLYLNCLQEEVADKLIGDRGYLAFFCNSGAEANEAAIKLARKASGKQEIISFHNSFHGRTFGAMAATGQDKIKEGFGDMLPHFSYANYNDLDSVKALVSDQTAAVMVELIQGESGVLPADPEFVQALAAFCKEKQILLIVDEVQTGIGRTGKLFAFEHYGILPDIVSLAKGLSNGLPAGAILGKSELGWAFNAGSHGSTFGGNKLAMAAASASLDVLKSPGFLEKVQENSAFLLSSLKQELADKNSIKNIRGIGYMIGIETDADLVEIVSKAREKGLIVLTAGTNVIRLLPPLTISVQEIKEAVGILKEVFS